MSRNKYPEQVPIEGHQSIPTIEFLKQTVRKNFTEIPGTARIVQALKDAGYNVGLVSDHAREWVQHYELNYPINQLFGARCYSFEEGMTKRNPELFKRALSKANARPGTTLYIDDRMFNINTATSKEVGIKYWHQFTDAANLEEALKDFDIKLF